MENHAPLKNLISAGLFVRVNQLPTNYLTINQAAISIRTES